MPNRRLLFATQQAFECSEGYHQAPLPEAKSRNLAASRRLVRLVPANAESLPSFRDRNGHSPLSVSFIVEGPHPPSFLVIQSNSRYRVPIGFDKRFLVIVSNGAHCNRRESSVNPPKERRAAAKPKDQPNALVPVLPGAMVSKDAIRTVLEVFERDRAAELALQAAERVAAETRALARHTDVQAGAPENRTGRPTKKAVAGERMSLGLKVTPDIKTRLDRAAQLSGRTQSQEAEMRLEWSFDRENLLSEVLSLAYGKKAAGFLMRLGPLIADHPRDRQP